MRSIHVGASDLSNQEGVGRNKSGRRRRTKNAFFGSGSIDEEINTKPKRK